MDLSKSLHPRIYAALDDWEQQCQSLEPKSPAMQQVLTRHQTIWLKTYGKPLLLRGAIAGVLAGALAGGVAWPLLGPQAAQTALAGAGAAGWLLQTLLFLHKNRRSVVPEELRNLVPALTLSALEKTYCEAMIGLAQNRQMAESDKQEIADQLNGLMDAYFGLEEQRATILAALGNGEGRAELEAERDSLVARREALVRSGNPAAVDPVTLSALEQSLELCEQRLSGYLSLEPSLVRLDAQTELIRQAVHSLCESLARLKAAPRGLSYSLADPDTTDIAAIKRRIDGITTQTRSVEQAVQEVLLLRGS